MSMGYGAAFADVIEEDELKKIVGAALVERFWAEHQQADEVDPTELFDQDGYEEVLSKGPDGERADLVPLCEAYKRLVGQFNSTTGLCLGLLYHDSGNDGSCYDDIDGFAWTVGGMYVLSEAGTKYKDVVKRNFFVTFG